MYIGQSNINKIYLGNNEVNKIYEGENLIYTTTVPPVTNVQRYLDFFIGVDKIYNASNTGSILNIKI